MENSEVDALGVGDSVKVDIDGRIYWLTVAAFLPDKSCFWGHVKGFLLGSGHLIRFELKHIIRIDILNNENR